MLDFLKKLFGLQSTSDRHPLDAVTTPNVSAPYKVPEPAATTPIPLVVTNSNPADNVPVATTPIPYVPEPPLVKLGPEPTVAPVVAKAAPAKKASAKPKAAAPKAEKAPAKPKAPKKPKISIAK